MEIRESDFDEMVSEADRPVLVDFWASWCPPCKMMQPVVEKLCDKVSDWADVYSINIDRSPGLASRFQVSGVPTFISFAGGLAVDRKTGALTEGQLTGLLQQALDAMPEADAEAVVEDAAEAVDETTSCITIVSGLPRSGTSLMMRMLEAGGVEVLTDEQRTADEDNPNGYYEFEDVKAIAEDTSWLARAQGRAVKMVYRLLKHLPADQNYRVIFMRRHTDEILQSQKRMLERNGIATDIPDEQMKAMFDRELEQFYAWLPGQSHLDVVNVSYNGLLANPVTVLSQINRHLDFGLDVDAMANIIDPSLYRHRAA
jgi:thioredoxin